MSNTTKQEVVATVTAAPKPPFSMAKCIAVLGVAVTILIGFLAYLFYNASYAGLKEGIVTGYNDAKEFVKKILASSGLTTIEVKTGQGRPVMMYVLWEQEQDVSYEYSTTWVGSTKSIKLFSKYKCFYGVDASLEGVDVSWNSPGVLKLGNPNVALIAMDPVGELKIMEEDGIWNRLQTKDREAAHNDLLRTARRIAANDTNALLITKLRFQELIRNGMSGGYKLITTD